MEHGFTDFGKTAYANGWFDFLNNDIKVAIFDIESDKFISEKIPLEGKRIENDIFFAYDTKIFCTESSSNFSVVIFANINGQDEVIANMLNSMVFKDPLMSGMSGILLDEAYAVINWSKNNGIANLKSLEV